MQQQGSRRNGLQGTFDRATLWRVLVTAGVFGLAALSIWAGQA